MNETVTYLAKALALGAIVAVFVRTTKWVAGFTTATLAP
jgi:hypothetical protein